MLEYSDVPKEKGFGAVIDPERETRPSGGLMVVPLIGAVGKPTGVGYVREDAIGVAGRLGGAFIVVLSVLPDKVC